MKALGIFDIKARLSEICDEVARTGEPAQVTKRGKPLAQIAPLPDPTRKTSQVSEARERVETENWCRSAPEPIADFPDTTRDAEPIDNPPAGDRLDRLFRTVLKDRIPTLPSTSTEAAIYADIPGLTVEDWSV